MRHSPSPTGQRSVRQVSWLPDRPRQAPSQTWNRLSDRGDVAQWLAARAAPYLELREILDAEKIEKALRKIGYVE